MPFQKHGRQYDLVVFGATGQCKLPRISPLAVLTDTRLHGQVHCGAHHHQPPYKPQMGARWALP